MRAFVSGLLLAAAAAALPAAADDAATPVFGHAPPAAVAEEEGYFARARELALQALAYIGVNYRYGGQSPETGFDCSGFVHYLFQKVAGRMLPRNASDISRVGETVQRDQLQPGDLVFFNTLRRPYSHVGIYLGENRFIHAPARGGAVEIVSMAERYWRNRYNGARRLPL
jgi:cell wall-associated NlpC family hydrolase